MNHRMFPGCSTVAVKFGDTVELIGGGGGGPRPPLIELHDDEIRFLYHRGLIDARTNRDAIHGRGAERAAARVTCAAFVDRLELHVGRP